MNQSDRLAKELPSEYADKLGIQYSSQVSSNHKKDSGQYFTPLPVAKFMADFCFVRKRKIKILDPGCGIGILSCALIESFLHKNYFTTEIELLAFETDSQVLPYAERCYQYLSQWLKKKGIGFSYFLCKNDFILHNSNALETDLEIQESYDIVIANPPYFKIRKDDPRAEASISIIHGQTNIYSIFLMVAAKLISKEGQLIFITPRSFASGNYFKVFREKFFSIVDVTNVHLFSSRKKAFERDKILQENIIVVARKKSSLQESGHQLSLIPSEHKRITISTSLGISDIGARICKEYTFSELVNFNSDQKIFHIPVSENDERAINLFKSWKCTLKDYEMKISTGPVIDFRSTDFIKDEEEEGCVPLIYLHNVEKMILRWPCSKPKRGKNKGQFIKNNHQSASRLIPNKDYILIRRFSTKDDSSRLIATPYLSARLKGYQMIGIENHLNYIYRSQGILSKDELYGLAGILNSKLFDVYFRTFNGNINVSATELREMPFPELDVIKAIGKKIIAKNKYDQDFINKIIEFEFGIDLN